MRQLYSQDIKTAEQEIRLHSKTSSPIYYFNSKLAKLFFLISLIFSCSTISYAQLSEGGKPASLDMTFRKSGQLVSSVTLQPINPEQLKAEDFSFGTPFRYGVVQDVAIDIKQ
ncbi:MAG TPA: hypothetical protein PKJ43_08475, partial [Prolixibacteraceae bacterium]|nr:hypothetical protein [Prolixibacteraceae bacterium]